MMNDVDRYRHHHLQYHHHHRNIDLKTKKVIRHQTSTVLPTGYRKLSDYYRAPSHRRVNIDVSKGRAIVNENRRRVSSDVNRQEIPLFTQ